MKLLIFYISIFILFGVYTANAATTNRTGHHNRKQIVKEPMYIDHKLISYRSYKPVFVKHKPIYPKTVEKDYDITSYDNEYGGVVSNFTSSVYDDNNPQLYPNPEIVARRSKGNKQADNKASELDDLPDDSLADADLKEHNVIDSVTYLYGFTNCQGVRNKWVILIFVSSGISVILLVGTIIWLMWGAYTAEFRKSSKLYPITINLCCCLTACALIYVQAVMGSSSPSQCERIALLLHYTHVSCTIWIVVLAAAVTEYCLYDSLLPLKYNYLLAYGVPAVVVMFNYALSLEHYETKHYCWMSIEKGMVMGFMVPTMILILINTGIIIIGLQNVNRKQAEILTTKIQEMVDHHRANWPKPENVQPKEASAETLDNILPSSSRKNTSLDTLDKDIYMSEDDCNIDGHEPSTHRKNFEDKRLLNLIYMENVSLKFTFHTEGNELKTYLNLCLVLEPFFAINWMMGVVAIENAAHWSTPSIYLVLVVAMYIYLTATFCTTLPIVRPKSNVPPPCCESVVTEPTLVRSRTTDSIPLLDPAIQQPNVTPTPADTISTISI